MKVCVLVRQGAAANSGENSPACLYAVEKAVAVKERVFEDVEITVISMGPPAAAQVLRSALALGCDEAYLLSDPGFGGADTWATAYTLMKGIEALGSFDLILCGDGSVNGGSGQVGPGVGAHLNLPVISEVSCIEGLDDGWIVARRAIEGGYEVVEAPLPVLLTLARERGEAHPPIPDADLNAAKAEIRILQAEDIGVDARRIGLRSSLTRLTRIFYRQQTAWKPGGTAEKSALLRRFECHESDSG